MPKVLMSIGSASQAFFIPCANCIPTVYILWAYHIRLYEQMPVSQAVSGACSLPGAECPSWFGAFLDWTFSTSQLAADAPFGLVGGHEAVQFRWQ